MPHTDQLSVISGCNSRASNVSGITGTSRSGPRRPHTRAHNDTLSPAVLDMLKTSTDTGGIGMPWHQGRGMNMQHSGRTQWDRPRGGRDLTPSHATRPPLLHYHSATTASSPRYPNVGQIHHRASVTSFQSMPPALRHVRSYGSAARQSKGYPYSNNGSRSHSLSSTIRDQTLPKHRSATSLGHSHNGRGRALSIRTLNGSASLSRETHRSDSSRAPVHASGSATHAESRRSAPFRTYSPVHRSNGPPPSVPDSSTLHSEASIEHNRSYHVNNDTNQRNEMPDVSRHYKLGRDRAAAVPPYAHVSYSPMLHHRGALYGTRFPAPPSSHDQSTQRPMISRAKTREVATRAHKTFHQAAQQVMKGPGTPISRNDHLWTDSSSSRTAPSSGPSTPSPYGWPHAAPTPAIVEQTSTEYPYLLRQLEEQSAHADSIDGHTPDIQSSGKVVIAGLDYNSLSRVAPAYGFVQKVKAILESKSQGNEAAKPTVKLGTSVSASNAGTSTDRSTDQHRYSPSKTSFKTIPDVVAISIEASEPSEASADCSLELPDHDMVDVVSKEPHQKQDDSTVVEVEQSIKRSISTTDISRPFVRHDQEHTSATANNADNSACKVSEQQKCTDSRSTTPSEHKHIETPAVRNEQQGVFIDHTTSAFATQSDVAHNAAPALSRRNGSPRTTRTHSQDLEDHVHMLDKGHTRSISADSGLYAKMNRDDNKMLDVDGQRQVENDSSDESDSNVDMYEHEIRAGVLRKKSAKSDLGEPVSFLLDVTSSSNRSSFPTDFSSTENATTDDTSEIITDVAVRFSLPPAESTARRPQDAVISSTNSLRRSKVPLVYHNESLKDEDLSLQNSLASIEEVLPLNVRKLSVVPCELSLPTASIDTTKYAVRTSIFAKEPSDEWMKLNSNFLTASHRSKCDTMLPRLIEESVEDMTTSFMHPATPNAVASKRNSPQAEMAMDRLARERDPFDSAKSRARSPRHRRNRSLGSFRDLPSLNFSRTDLIDKLNAALRQADSWDYRFSEHIDTLPVHSRPPLRSRTSKWSHDRYMSFFSRPEDFTVFEVIPRKETVGESRPTRMTPIIQVQESSEVQDETRIEQALSLLDVASQVNRLSIPSVNRLSERLSEIIPCLRNLHLDGILDLCDDDAATDRQTMNSIEGRASTAPSLRISKGSVASSKQMHEFAADDIRGSRSMDALLGGNSPAALGLASTDNGLAIRLAEGTVDQVRDCVSAPPSLQGGSQRRHSLTGRCKTPTSAAEVRKLLPPEGNPLIRLNSQVKASFGDRLSSSEDKNQPRFSSISQAILIDPACTVTGDGKLENGTSIQDKSQTRPCSLELATDTQTTCVAGGQNLNAHKSQQSREENEHGINASLTNGSEDSQPHRPGDRYPTSALFAPTNFNLDEVRSYFSDDSSEESSNGRFRKRLTGFRYRGVHVNSTEARGSADSLFGIVGPDGGMLYVRRTGVFGGAHACHEGATALAEDKIRRMSEKLRGWMARGGFLLRTWTIARVGKGMRRRDESPSDSLFSSE